MGQRLCHRFGPGRLPYTARTDVGGGVAMAATGLLAAVLWFGGVGLLLASGLAGAGVAFLLAAGVIFLPLTIPTAFVTGMFLWRTIPSQEARQVYGAVFGGITAVVGMAGGALGLAMFLAISNVISGELTVVAALGFAVGTAILAFFFAVVVAGWLIVPLGVFGGWYHERAKVTP